MADTSNDFWRKMAESYARTQGIPLASGSTVTFTYTVSGDSATTGVS